jgi:pimeloyl-ACP methyl ester carboxylesterase
MPRAFVNGIGINYQQAGVGPDLVLVHGLAANLAFWYIRILPFLIREFRVTVYDLRGHGFSDMPHSKYTSADMAKDLGGLLGQLGIDQAHLVGHSFGGLVALHFAVLFPKRVSSLTIADSRVGALQPAPRVKDWSHWRIWQPRLARLGVQLDEDQELDFSLLGKLAEYTRHGVLPTTNDPLLFTPFETWNGGKRSAQRWLYLLNTTTAKEDFKAQAGLTLNKIRRMHRPTLAIYGQYSFCLPSCRGLQQNLTHCQSVFVRRAGHFHPVIKPRIFLKNLQKFLLPQISGSTPKRIQAAQKGR